MNKRSRIQCAVLALLAGVAASPCAAEDSAWTLGLGVAVFDSPYRSADDTAAPLPLMSYENGRLSVGPWGARFSIDDRSGLDFAVIAQPRIQPVDFDEAPALAGVEQRDSTAELGLGVRLDAGGVTLTMEALTDALGVHDGAQISMSVGADLWDGPVALTPHAGLAWQSAELVDYYYGVRASEARPDLAAYEADDAMIVRLGLDLRYPLSYQLWAIAMTSYDILPDEIAASPLVEDDGASRTMLGLMYNF